MPNKQIDDLDEEIRELLRRKAEAMRVTEQHLRHTLGRSDRRLGRNAVVLLVAALLAGYGIVEGVRSLQGSATPKPGGSTHPLPAPTTVQPAASWVQVPGDLRNLPLGVAGSEGAVWVVTGGNIPFPAPGSDSDPGAQTALLSRVDPDSGKVTKTVQAGGAGDVRLVAAFGDAWVLRPGYDQVIRFDGTSLSQIATIAVSDPEAAASDGASLWVVSGGTGIVSRVDPNTNHVVDTVETGIDATGPQVDENGSPIPPYNGTPTVGIAASGGSVWVHGKSQLVQIDAATGSPGPGVSVDGQVEGLVASEAGVWITLCTPAEGPACSWVVARVDPATGTLAQTIPLGEWRTDPNPGNGGSVVRVDLAMDGADVWASLAVNYDGWSKGKAVEIDLVTAKVVLTFSVDGSGGTNDVAHTSDTYGPPLVQGNIMWIINLENNEVARLDLGA